MSLIESRLEGHIGTLTMNHPEHRNALSAAGAAAALGFEALRQRSASNRRTC